VGPSRKRVERWSKFLSLLFEGSAQHAYSGSILALMLSFGLVTLPPHEALSFNEDPDVIKSRIQLRPIPPTGNPLRYMNEELRAVVAEGGMYVHIHS
jgi:hypothetical protein